MKALRFRLVVAPIAAALLAVSPALAVPPGADGVTCAAGVTTHMGTNEQRVVDLEPTYVQVLAYSAEPKGREDFMQLMHLGTVPIRLYVYRVTEDLLHMQIFEQTDEGKEVLADTPLIGEMGELTWRTLGGSAMVTAYCY